MEVTRQGYGPAAGEVALAANGAEEVAQVPQPRARVEEVGLSVRERQPASTS